MIPATILEVVYGSKPEYKEFGEAPDDDPDQLQQFARRVRKGQPQFRRKLLSLYEEKCCITGWQPESILEAAHVTPHAKTGINASNNGLLLRSDLHVLFDDGLLKINPETFDVVIDQALKTTPYWELNGKKLRTTRDGQYPKQEYLRERWTESVRVHSITPVE